MPIRIGAANLSSQSVRGDKTSFFLQAFRCWICPGWGAFSANLAILPAMLLLLFGAIWLYDKARGGYRPEKIIPMQASPEWVRTSGPVLLRNTIVTLPPELWSHRQTSEGASSFCPSWTDKGGTSGGRAFLCSRVR